MVTLYPLELIKTRMQVMHNSDKAYLSLRHAARKVFVNEGIYGLYRGVVPAAVAASGSWGGYFYFYELSKQRKLHQNTCSSSLDTVDHVRISPISKLI
ncbi:solute carrier family 25 protein [archaeon]|nr:MAG: solute carrier family 25 protein [archaeon]